MANFYLLAICFCLGVLFKKYRLLPESTPKVLSGFIMYISLPSLVLYHVHEIKISNEIFFPAIMPWLVFGLGFILFLTLYKIKFISFKVSICLMLTAGLGNTSFVGFPLLESYLGKEALGFGIISDQFGTFLALSFPGIILASVAEKGDWDFNFLIQRIIRFAPMYALVFAFLLRPIEYPDDLKILLIRLGDTLSPLALVSVGYLLDIKHFKGYEKVICIGLIFKLVFSPLLIYVLFKPFDLNTLMFQTTVLEAGMAPMVTSSIVAIEKEIEPQLAAIMLGFGIPLSFLTTGIIYFFITGT